jgi:hypothetical protein
MFRVFPVETFFSWFIGLFSADQPSLCKVHQDHDLRHYQDGRDYFLTTISTGNRAYLTIQRSGIKIKDYLILRFADGLKRYQVESVEYYWEPEDMCVLLLRTL